MKPDGPAPENEDEFQRQFREFIAKHRGKKSQGVLIVNEAERPELYSVYTNMPGLQAKALLQDMVASIEAKMN